jgi:hypothetical protein
MGSLKRRVEALEDAAGGRECPECGFDGDWSNVDIVVEWWDGEEEYTGPKQTVYCETCGEPTVSVVTWNDIPPDEVGDIKEEI